MKKALLLLPFFLVLGIAAVNAQACHSASAGKSCCASKAAMAASSDATIEKRMGDDGAVSYVRKESDTQGNVKFVSVQYDETSNAFVNVAPKVVTAEGSTGMVKKSCAAAGSGKACCAGGAKEGKACCAAKASTTQVDQK